jgi:Sec-independent protein translocase protein TatA
VAFGGKIGLPELLLILAVALYLGTEQLADLGKGLGQGVRNFKSSERRRGKPRKNLWVVGRTLVRCSYQARISAQ